VEIASHLIVGGAKRARTDEFFLEVALKRRDERLNARLRQLDQQHMAAPAAKAEKSRGWEVREINEDAWPQAEVADAPARLVLDHAADREWRLANEDLIAHLHIERGQKLRAHEDAEVREHRVRVRLVGFELQVAVERKRRLNGPQFDHARHRPARIR